MDPAADYSRILRHAGRRAVPALARELRLNRRAAAEAWGAAGGLVLAGLARHQGRRAPAANAAQGVLDKYARPADVDAADLAIPAHLARPERDRGGG
ncbi:MAG TPA: hypothetical protein VND21_10405, partial [Planctomycetota bacterium]|nr:hypothetical protein [Planctomycetota bacterium]